MLPISLQKTHLKMLYGTREGILHIYEPFMALDEREKKKKIRENENIFQLYEI